MADGSAGTGGSAAPPPALDHFDERVTRIVARRKAACSKLSKDVVIKIVTTGLEITPGLAFPENIVEDNDPFAKFEWLLSHYLRVSYNDDVPCETRRNALGAVKKMFAMMDKAVSEVALLENQRVAKEKAVSREKSAAKAAAGAKGANNDAPKKKVSQNKDNHAKMSPATAALANGKKSPATAVLTNGKTTLTNGKTATASATKPNHNGKTTTSIVAPPPPASSKNGTRPLETSTITNGKKAPSITGTSSNGKQPPAIATTDKSQKGLTNNSKSLPPPPSARESINGTKTLQRKDSGGSRSENLVAMNGAKKTITTTQTSQQMPQRKNSNGSKAGSNNLLSKPGTNQRVSSLAPSIATAASSGSGSSAVVNVASKSSAAAAQVASKPAAPAQSTVSKPASAPRRTSLTHSEAVTRNQSTNGVTAAGAPPKPKPNINIENNKRAAEEWRIRQKMLRSNEIAAVLKANDQTTPHRDVEVVFPPDPEPTEAAQTKSGAINVRSQALQVRIAPRPLSKEQAEDLSTRLSRWEPYWRAERYVACGVTTNGKVSPSNKPSSMVASCRFSIDPKDIQDMKQSDWGTNLADKPVDKQMRLLLRMIPVTPNKKYPRADTHLWPKGSFVVLNRSPIDISRKQRRQQSHDPLKWLGLSYQLDLTQLVKRPTDQHGLDLLTYDNEPYYYCIALCRYVSPASLFQRLVKEPVMEKLTREQSIEKALTYTRQATLALDGAEGDDLGKFVFTLTCPYSKSALVKPVRGKKCRHFQCFDLKSFLDSNALVSGTRWRCLVCEDFLSICDLEACGLTEDIASEFRKEISPTVRDAIEFCSDKSYRLLSERKKRNNKKRPGGPDAPDSNPAVKKKANIEVICLD